MSPVIPISVRELSSKTRPGKLGFKYAIELNLKFGNSAVDFYDRNQRYLNFLYECENRLGKPYQQHWYRKQLNRKWYIQHMHDNIVRICCKSKNHCLMLQMIY
jgi:hypothetical protein